MPQFAGGVREGGLPAVIEVREVQVEKDPRPYVLVEAADQMVVLTRREAVELVEKLADLVVERGWA